MSCLPAYLPTVPTTQVHTPAHTLKLTALWLSHVSLSLISPLTSSFLSPSSLSLTKQWCLICKLFTCSVQLNSGFFLSYDKLWKRTFLFFSLAIFRQPTVWSTLGLAQGAGWRLGGTGLLCIIMTSEEKRQKFQLKKRGSCIDSWPMALFLVCKWTFVLSLLFCTKHREKNNNCFQKKKKKRKGIK